MELLVIHDTKFGASGLAFAVLLQGTSARLNNSTAGVMILPGKPTIQALRHNLWQEEISTG